MAIHLRATGYQGRKVQLILRNPDGTDKIVLDILQKEECGDCTGIIMAEGMEGLYHTRRTLVRKSGSYQEGSTLTMFPRVEERLPKITLMTRGRSLREFERLENLLWKVLSLRWDCYLRVYSELSQWRELKVRLEDVPSDKTNTWLGLGDYTHVWECPLLAVDPFWYSREIKRSIKRAQMTPQGDGSYLGYIELVNPADQDCYPDWASNELTVTTVWQLPDGFGIYTAATAPTPDKIGQPVMHKIPDASGLGPGKEFLVQTYPDRPTLLVRDGGQDWARMRGEAFDFPLPAGTVTPQSVPVRVTGGTDDSEVTCYMPQRWDRYMGGEA
ncbi:hypothetical protein HH308_06360 [Gordonia sp. TBRC 11910]|uniref:Uncharacterized protein n=1 Tax=Gordonia asplenii TaxID=2725283 RepID=A0A848KVD9_9ACTN|nr:hypothetical protein [Gordonia asplenii]NMO00835.1 hypothetical protein [Gordonia asplenii]